VILVDINVLVYASIPALEQHQAAKQWLDNQLNGSTPVGLPWASTLGYLRLVTNSRIFTPPVPMPTAWQRVSAWLTADPVWTPAPTERHADVLGNLLASPGVHGNLVPDAHLAALAIEHGLTLCSTDSDFARFPGLRWVNPITR
jgi:toxin-antitoxin system PIN domain toxin